MDRITAAKAFITIVEQGSFVAAAEQLNLSRAGASRCVTELENWTKTKLLHRSTRRLSLTPAGEKMLEHCRQLVEVADTISQETISTHGAPTGTLRISSSQYFAQTTLLCVLEEYVELYPDVKVELHVSNQMVNLIEDRIDIAIRISNDLDPNLIARRLGTCKSTLCASPAYIEKHGMPRRIQELSAHNCLLYSNFDHQHWHFRYKGEAVSVPVSGNIGCNESLLLLQASVKGLGIGYQPSDAVAPYLESGELVEILKPYEPEDLGIFSVFLTRENMPLAQRKMLDLLAQYLR